MDREAIERFLGELEAVDGGYPLSEAKTLRLDVEESRVVIAEDGVIVAVGIGAPHAQSSSIEHWSLESAVTPSMRFPTFELAVVEAARVVVPTGAPFSVWSDRSSLDAALDRAGYVRARRLLYLTIDPPIPPSDVTRALRADEFPEFVAVNGDAFEGHREAASLDEEELRTLAAQPWFDIEGIRVVEGAEGFGGFCWTKVHPNGDGEVYRIGVAKGERGKGLGRALLSDGYAYLFGNEDVRRGSLWVDEANAAALGLYRDFGMSVTRYSSEFEPPG